MNSPSPTLQQIADKAGYSKNTVSLALRNSPRISKTTRKKIQRLADKIGYVPNAKLREMMTQIRNPNKDSIKEILGILVDWPASSKSDLSYHQHQQLLFDSFEKRALKLGYGFDYLFLSSPGMNEKRMSSIIRIRGIAVMPMAEGPARLHLNFDSIASIQIGRTLWSPKMDTVSANDADSIYLASKVLRRRGYKRIGYFFSRWALAQSLNRLEMGAIYSQKHIVGLTPLPIGISELQRTQQDVLDGEKLKKEFLPWFKKHKPEVIVCLGTPVKAILENNLNLSVPEDIGIVQYDYVPKPGLELAGINHQKDLQAAYAVERLATKTSHGIYGIPESPIEVSFPVKWVDGPTIRD